MLKLHVKWKPILQDVYHLLILLVISAFVTAQSEWVFRSSLPQTGFFIANHFLQYGYETLFVFLVTALLYYIIRKVYIAAFLSTLLFAIASTANYIKVSTRSEPLLPWDLTIVGDATKIISHAKLHITYEVILSYVFVIIITVGLFLLRKKLNPAKLHIIARAALSVLLAAATLFLTADVFMNDRFITKHNIKEISWSQVDNYKQNGFIFSFLNNLSHRSVVKPANYSEAAVDNAVKSISKKETSTLKPNIIIVQDEAFCDLTQFKNVKFQQNIMPTITKLRQSYPSGYTLTPMYGGGTCNSEFEVLTGFSYSDLPNGSVPYEEYFKHPTFSYASFLKSIGYSAVAVHSFDRTFWDRNTVFKSMGFDKFVAEDNFSNPQMRRGFISDLDTMKMITKQYKANQQSGKPFFNYTITMQNHFSWGTDDYPADYRVKLSAPGLTDEEQGVLTSYATGVRDADAALGYLINYFSKVKQPTIVVFFGDHMPALNEHTLTVGGYLNGDLNSPANVQKLHSTPYVIWNNFGQKSTAKTDLSMYNLVPYMTQSFDLQRPLYFDYLLDQFKSYQGYSTGVYIDSGNKPTMTMPAGGQNYHDLQYLFEYDLLIGNQYGQSLTK